MGRSVDRITLRPAVAADAAGIAELHAASWRATYHGIVPGEAMERINAGRCEQWRTILSDRERAETVLLAEEDGRLAGFVSFGKAHDSDLSPDTGEIYGLYLHPDFLRRGIGSLLVERALVELNARGFPRNVLWCFEENLPALQFYERTGFSFDGARKTIDRGRPVTVVRMIL